MRGGAPSLPKRIKARFCASLHYPTKPSRRSSVRQRARLKVLRCESILLLSSPEYNWVHDLCFRPDGQDEAPFQ